MQLQPLDWLIVLATLAICFIPALFFGKRAGKNTSEFFASGRSVPWWLAGLSMVATTFSSDTPNWVTQQVRQYGVAGKASRRRTLSKRVSRPGNRLCYRLAGFAGTTVDDDIRDARLGNNDLAAFLQARSIAFQIAYADANATQAGIDTGKCGIQFFADDLAQLG